MKTSPIFLCLSLMFMFASTALAQSMGPLERCVLQDGGEVYVARDAAKKDLNGFDCKMRQPLGFVYLEQTDSTVPIYSVTKTISGLKAYRVVTSANAYAALQTTRGGSWTPYPGDGVIGYVSFTKMPGTIGAYAFTQTNVKNDQERYRFEGKELDTWGAIKGTNFNNTPTFFIWKEQKYGAGVDAFKKLQDITFRDTVYANGSNSEKINFSAKYGTPTKPLVLSCTTAVATSDKYCQFNIGILLTRTDTATQQTVTVIANGGETNVGNSVVFQKGKNTAEIILPIKISKAKSTLTITLGELPPEQDKNRDNNSFKVKTMVTTN